MKSVIKAVMRTLFAVLCLAFVTACSGQAITRQQLTNYAVGMNSGKATNLTHYGSILFTNKGPIAPNLYFANSDGSSGLIFQWLFPGQFWGVVVQSNDWQLTDSGLLSDSFLHFWKDANTASIGRGGGTITNNADLRVTGIGYDQNNVPYATTRNASNAVQVVAGGGTIVTAAGAGNQMTFTVTSTAGAGATNAVSSITTNGAIGGLGIQTLSFDNGYGNTVAGVSNNQAFTLTWTVDFGPATNYANAVGLGNTNLSYALALAASNLSYAIGANNTNFALVIGAAATNLANAYSVALTNALAAKQDGYANLSALGNSGIGFPGTSMIESNVNQIFWNLQRMTVATNSSTSNLTVNVRTNKYYFTITNNITVTNFTGIADGVASDTTIIIEPQLIPRGIAYPTMGGSSFGIYANTNANAPMWTTLTNGNRYALTVSSFGTNTFWSISLWK